MQPVGQPTEYGGGMWGQRPPVGVQPGGPVGGPSFPVQQQPMPVRSGGPAMPPSSNYLAQLMQMRGAANGGINY